MGIITKVKNLNLKSFEKSELEFSEDAKIIVGNNDAGKSIILEAIRLCLTGYFQG